jgi:hypothetical protein
MEDSTINQKWAGEEENRIEKRDAREREQDATLLCLQEGGGGGVAHHLRLHNNFGHDGTHLRGRNTAITSSKIAGKPGLVYLNNIV